MTENQRDQTMVSPMVHLAKICLRLRAPAGRIAGA
jgi:hypothetical protein